MSRLRDAVIAVMFEPAQTPPPAKVVDLVLDRIRRAADVQIIEMATIDPQAILVNLDPDTGVLTIHAHRSHHEGLVELLQAWHEIRKPQCSKCGGSNRVLLSGSDPRVLAHFSTPGVRVTAVKAPMVEIPCPCPCHAGGA